MTRDEPGRSAPKPSLINVPNGLTLLRLALVPVFVALLVHDRPMSRVAAFVVFGVASVTDLLDGELARRGGKITDFGKIADPIADKALTGSALITLSALGALTWWVTGIIMLREVGVTLLRFWVIRHGVIPASRGGKIKTVLQIAAIGLYILPADLGPARSIVMITAVVVTLATGADYVARAIHLRRAVPGRERVLGGRPPGPAERAVPAGRGAVPPGLTSEARKEDGVLGAPEPRGVPGSRGAVPPGLTSEGCEEGRRHPEAPRHRGPGVPGVVPRASGAGGRPPGPTQPAASSAGEAGPGQ